MKGSNQDNGYYKEQRKQGTVKRKGTVVHP